MEQPCEWFDDMADEGAADDEDERIRWYESVDCNGGMLGEAEDGNESSEGAQFVDDNDSFEGAQFVCNGDSVVTNHGVNTTCISECLGSIYPPYGSIITDCIANVFGITTPKDWQLLLIQSIVFNTNANKLGALFIRRTGDGKSLPI